ncbi:MAG: RagB/SusD family nutrient uptake outer membrane protein, partial [Bacteroidetes bacterium]
NKSIFGAFGNNDSESIFRLLSTETDISGNNLTTVFTTASAQWTINPNLKETLNEFALDSRWQNFYSEKQGKIFSRKYDVPQAHLPILRFAEQLLIRAESNASLNANISVIKTDLNKIRLRANLPVDNATNSAEGFLAIIEKEWLREFALEGNYFFYQKRLNKKIGNLNANDPKLVLPIPQREINLNSNLIQNKGY